MKGFIDERGRDRPACDNCKHRNRSFSFAVCRDCISSIERLLYKRNYEVEFVNFEDGDPKEADE